MLMPTRSKLGSSHQGSSVFAVPIQEPKPNRSMMEPAEDWYRCDAADEDFFNSLLKNYASYYNQVRTHLSLDKNAPDFRRPQKLGHIASIPILGGLHHQYVRVWVLTKHSAVCSMAGPSSCSRCGLFTLCELRVQQHRV